MDWHRIDLGPEGEAGIEARWRRDGDTVYCYIGGSDHWRDWLHHVLPGAWRREIRAAQEIATTLARIIGMAGDGPPLRVVIGGHSLGGAVACSVAEFFTHQYGGTVSELDLFTYGAKRIRWETTANGTHFRHLGDVVPFLPPWRPKYKNVEVFGSWRPFWIAHGPRTYYDLQIQHGFRA